MTIAENMAERLTYKAYATGDITPGSEPVAATDPAATGGQILRYVSQNLALTRGYNRPNERRTDRQKPMGRLGIPRAPGQINGLLSPATYADLFEATLRGTWAAAVTKTEADLTSAAFDSSTAKITFGGGDPVDEGLKVGDIIRFTGLTTEVANNNKNFVILSFGGTSNRELTVYPAPTTGAADTTFSVSNVQSLIIPSSAHVKRKFAFEVYNSDVDVARLFTECRLGGLGVNLPAEGEATVNFNVLGRNRQVLSGASAPFFTAPAAQTTTEFFGPVGGLVRAGSTTLGVLTALSLNLNLNPQAPAVRAAIAPEIFLDDADVTGEFSVFLEDATFLDAFEGEDELALLAYLTADDAAAAAAMTLHLPRIKITSNDESDDGSGGKIIRCAFAASRYLGAGAGIEGTTLRICDTEVS